MTTHMRQVGAAFGPFARPADLHDKEHELNGADHIGNLDEVKVAFDASSGHSHDGVGSRSVDHAFLLGKGTNSHDTIDAHIANLAIHPTTANAVGAVAVDKVVAIPVTDEVAVNATYHRVQSLASLFVFVGQSAGDNPNGFITLLGQDGTLLLDAQQRPVLVDKVTSDAAGTVSVIGQGYVNNQPYIHFKDQDGAPYNPNANIKVRYGIRSSMGELPEDVLLREAVWVGETEADMRFLIAGIKGSDVPFDSAPIITLEDTKNRLDALDELVTGGGAGTSSLVYKSNIIADLNASTETTPNNKILLAKLPAITEEYISRVVPTFARLGSNETITGDWTHQGKAAFNGGLAIPHGTSLPSPEAAQVFLKTDTKELYAVFGGAWELAGGKPVHRMTKKNTTGQGDWTLLTLAGVLNGGAFTQEKKDSIFVWRGGLMQSYEDGHYTMTDNGNDVLIEFTSPVPEGTLVICTWLF